LQAEDLDAERWRALQEHWTEAMRGREERRDRKLLGEQDRGYVNELEAQRGPIAIDDFARFAEAAERGAQAEALAERNLPAAAWPHLQRFWIDRVLKDPVLAEQVRRAMAARRTAG